MNINIFKIIFVGRARPMGHIVKISDLCTTSMSDCQNKRKGDIKLEGERKKGLEGFSFTPAIY